MVGCYAFVIIVALAFFYSLFFCFFWAFKMSLKTPCSLQPNHPVTAHRNYVHDYVTLYDNIFTIWVDEISVLDDFFHYLYWLIFIYFLDLIATYLFYWRLFIHFLDLIDDITDGVDRVHSKVERTEKHVKKVTKKSGSCGKSWKCRYLWGWLFFL